MKVLIVHNAYQQPGGEDVVAAQEARLLRQAGHEVIEYRRSNHEINVLSLRNKVALATRAIWAGDTVRDLRALIHREKPHVAHFHNTFVMISPSAYRACHEMRVPVVQTLHNYRLLLPASGFFSKRPCLRRMSRQNTTMAWDCIWVLSRVASADRCCRHHAHRASLAQDLG